MNTNTGPRDEPAVTQEQIDEAMREARRLRSEAFVGLFTSRKAAPTERAAAPKNAARA